jgi:hypothetical protein
MTHWWTWTSAVEIGHDEDFYWDSTGAVVGPHYNWAENEPVVTSNPEHYIKLSHDGETYKWFNHGYFGTYPGTYPYICEAKIQ